MKKFTTMSDVGSVLIGVNEFTVLIRNGRGDGVTQVEIYENDSDFNQNGWNFLSSVQGDFNIYDYDCCVPSNDRVLTTIHAKRTGFFNNDNGAVAFVVWEK